MCVVGAYGIKLLIKKANIKNKNKFFFIVIFTLNNKYKIL